MRWYVSTNGQTSGPHEESEIRRLVEQGRLTAESDVRDDQGGPWGPVASSPLRVHLQQGASTGKAQQSPWIGCFGLMVACAFAYWAWCTPSAKEKAKAEAKEAAEQRQREATSELIGAWTMCQQFVKDHLKSPSTADFGSVFREYQDPDRVVTKLTDKTYRCEGWVDSQNGFGAKVRTDFSMTVKDVGGDRWRVTEGPTLEQR